MKGDSQEAFISEQRKSSTDMDFIRTQIRDAEESEIRCRYVRDANGLILMKKYAGDPGRVVVPESLRPWIMHMHHNAQLAGHQGIRRTIRQIHKSFCCPEMKTYVARWIKSCMACRRRKTPRPMRAGLTTPQLAAYPNQTMAMDIQCRNPPRITDGS